MATYICYDAYMKRTTIFLPDELHEELRGEAFRTRVSMAEVIRLRIQTPAKAQAKRKWIGDPLLKVAGICGDAVMSANIDDELYGERS
jgi:hypothetical protein